MEDPVRIHRKEAVGMDQLVRQYIRSMKLSAGLNTQRIFAAWDACSGAGHFTLRRYFRDGRLYITLNSSVIRNQLSFQKKELIEKMNACLLQDDLYTKDSSGAGPILELILK